MRSQLKKLFVLLLIFCAFMSYSHSEESEDWYVDKTITKITFKGLKSVRQSDLSGMTSSYIGQKFNDCFYDLLNRLEGLNYFEEIVPGAIHDSGNGVILVLNVVEKPVVTSIKFKGNKKVRNPPLRDAISLKVGNVFSDSEALMDERAIRDVYLEKGFPSVKVSHTYEESETGVAVTFIISEGNSIALVGINFEGNSAFPTKKLKKQTKLKKAGIFSKGAFQERKLTAK